MTVYSGEYIEGLETRIRELEEQLKDLEAENHNLKALIVSGENWTEKGAAAHLAQRIAKAKEILESSDGMTQKMKDALAVLEGK